MTNTDLLVLRKQQSVTVRIIHVVIIVIIINQ